VGGWGADATREGVSVSKREGGRGDAHPSHHVHLSVVRDIGKGLAGLGWWIECPGIEIWRV
jgi:hypothetical protein